MTSTPPTNPSNPESARSDEIDIGQLVGLLVDRWVMILSITTLFTVSGIFYAFSARPIFQADALIQVEEEKQGLDVAAMLGGELGTDGSSTKAEIEIIQSRMVLGDAVKRTGSDIVINANRMPLIGSFLTNLGFESGPLGLGYGYSWSSDHITVTRFDAPAGALNQPHLIEFSDTESFTLSLDGSQILEGRVGQPASDTEGFYRLFIQTKRGPSTGSFTVTRLDQLSAIEELRERLGVSERGKDTGILSVTLDSTSRREASETLQQISQIF